MKFGEVTVFDTNTNKPLFEELRWIYQDSCIHVNSYLHHLCLLQRRLTKKLIPRSDSLKLGT